jgi:hypothetical protein
MSIDEQIARLQAEVKRDGRFIQTAAGSKPHPALTKIAKLERELGTNRRETERHRELRGCFWATVAMEYIMEGLSPLTAEALAAYAEKHRGQFEKGAYIGDREHWLPVDEGVLN